MLPDDSDHAACHHPDRHVALAPRPARAVPRAAAAEVTIVAGVCEFPHREQVAAALQPDQIVPWKQ